MPRTMRSSALRSTATTGLRGRDVLIEGAAAAHADAELGRTDADVARRYTNAGRKTSRRAASEWRRVAPPESREFHAYLLVVSDPYRIEASVRATVKQRVLSKLSDADLIDRFHELRGVEKELEGIDNATDLRRGVDWIARAAQKERDAAIESELAACFREFATRGLGEQDVFGR